MATQKNGNVFTLVKVDPKDPIPALAAMYEFLTGRALTDQEKEEMKAELARKQPSQALVGQSLN